MNGDVRCAILRSALREGWMDAGAQRETIIQLYHVERAAENMPDGPEFWYDIEVALDP